MPHASLSIRIAVSGSTCRNSDYGCDGLAPRSATMARVGLATSVHDLRFTIHGLLGAIVIRPLRGLTAIFDNPGQRFIICLSKLGILMRYWLLRRAPHYSDIRPELAATPWSYDKVTVDVRLKVGDVVY